MPALILLSDKSIPAIVFATGFAMVGSLLAYNAVSITKLEKRMRREIKEKIRAIQK